jgi:ERCC4-type nuclease
LLIEGEYRTGDDGLVALRAGRSLWKPAPERVYSSELSKTLIGLPLRAGTLVWETRTRHDTIAWITNLYRNWTDKPWDAHTSHIAVYRPPTLVPISNKRITFSTIPGIGIKTSKVVEAYFRGNVRRAANAPPHEWSKIDGIGPKTAERIVAYLQEDS